MRTCLLASEGLHIDRELWKWEALAGSSMKRSDQDVDGDEQETGPGQGVHDGITPSGAKTKEVEGPILHEFMGARRKIYWHPDSINWILAFLFLLCF